MSEEPIHAHVETICDLADAIKIERAQSDGMEFESAPAAHANPSANSLLSHTTNAAGFGEAVAENAEVGRHPAYMEGRTWVARATAKVAGRVFERQ